MSVHLTEEEQLETLKRWWKEHGTTVMVAIVVAVGGYFGVTTWQQQQQQQVQTASGLYDNLLQLASPQMGQPLSEDEKTTVYHLADQLKEKRSSLYAHNAALLLARLAIEDGNLDQAATELRWVLANKPDLTTEQITRLRLARVLIAQDDLSGAESLLSNPVDAFKGEYAEVRGDLARARGDLAAAQAAYQDAVANVDAQQQERSMLLQFKLDDVKSSLAANNPESAQ